MTHPSHGDPLDAPRPHPSPVEPENPSIWRSALFAAGMVTATCVWAPLTLFTFPFSYPKRYAFVVFWCRIVLFWLRTTCRLQHQIHGLEHIPAEPVVVLAKHQSAWETICLTGLFRPQVWVLKRELLFLPFFGWGLAMLRPIAIDRGARRAAIKQVLAQGKDRLNRGCNVVVFPEGTRVPAGKRKRYGLGGTLLAKESGYPIVPVAHNAGLFWPRRSFLKRPGTVQMVIGKPLDPRAHSAEELKRLAEDWIEAQVERLTGIKAEPLQD